MSAWTQEATKLMEQALLAWVEVLRVQPDVLTRDRDIYRIYQRKGK